MKKVLVITLAMLILLTLGVTSVLAGKGDDQPEVGYRPIDTSCGIVAGEWGNFNTPVWWWAVYSNDRGVLKCEAKLDKGQTPPETVVTLPGDSVCGTPGGTTDNYFVRVFPSGRVSLICRLSLDIE